MTPYPHLDKAPIQEALIDVRATLARELDLEEIRDRGSPVAGFPTVKQAKQVEAHLELERKTVRSRVSTRGIIFQSEDEHRVVQFRNDGFTFNWLPPYSTWEELFEQTNVFWQHYSAVAHPEEVTRIAVRYINRFPVELPIELGDVFTISLELPPGIDGVVGDFLYRATFRDTPSGKMCSMTLTGERSPGDSADIIFDIVCFEQRNFKASDPVVWDEVLPSLRDLKNRVFFSGLTPARIERFK